MTIEEGLDWAIGSLKDIENPRRNAEILLEEILGLEKAEFYSRGEESFPQKKLSLFRKLIKRRSRNFPLQYILGKAAFMGLEFVVDESTLIPRPETEILVEKILEEADKTLSLKRSSPIVIIDLGTGCGNIAIALAKNIPCSQIYALDISREALKVARGNSCRHGLAGSITFLEGDLFRPLGKIKEQAEIIVSNPPYIARGDFSKLPPEVRFEPHSALDGGKEGLDFYQQIIDQAPTYLKKEGLLGFEIGMGQSPSVCNLIRAKREFSSPEVIKDYRRIERIVLTRKSN